MESDTFNNTRINGNSSTQKSNGCVHTDQTKSIHKNNSDKSNDIQNVDRNNGYHGDSPEKRDIPINKDTKKTNGETDINDIENTERDGPVRKRPRLVSS